MSSYYYTIELLSDAAPGSGDVTEIHLDSEVPLDEYGLPHIPGKRIKGLLYESALDFQEAVSLIEEMDFVPEVVEKLFGGIGDSQSASIQITDAYLEDYSLLRYWLDWINTDEDAAGTVSRFFTTDRIRDVYTHIRTQTALENGLVKENSLRSLRLLNRGLIFMGKLEIPEEMESEFWLLHLSAGNVTRMGLHRNRGLGRIRFTLLDQDRNPLTENYSLEKILERRWES